MTPEPLNVHINLVALQATFFRRLQHQLDVIKVLQVGCELVTAQQVEEQREFGSFVPANGAVNGAVLFPSLGGRIFPTQ